MRFKKLRLSVGIALMVFIFVVGNIIILGQLVKEKSVIKKSSDENVMLVDPKTTVPQNSLVKEKSEQTTKKSRDIGDTTSDKKFKPAVKPNSVLTRTTRSSIRPVVIYHARRRTRAS